MSVELEIDECSVVTDARIVKSIRGVDEEALICGRANANRTVSNARPESVSAYCRNTQSRSATIGSTAAARLAGRYDATRATTPSTTGTVANVSGS